MGKNDADADSDPAIFFTLDLAPGSGRLFNPGSGIQDTHPGPQHCEKGPDPDPLLTRSATLPTATKLLNLSQYSTVTVLWARK